MEKRTARHQKRQDMAKRRTVAAQERMRIISELARKDNKKDDNFGMRDEDWDVYKAIRRVNIYYKFRHGTCNKTKNKNLTSAFL